MTNWNKRFISLAKEISSWSKDTIGVGCIITDSSNNNVLASGYNGMPSWFNDKSLPLIDKPTRSIMITHAEINALNVLDVSHYNKDLTLYVTRPPCKYCALSIIHSNINIKNIFYLLDNKSEKDIIESIKLLNKHGIKMELIL